MKIKKVKKSQEKIEAKLTKEEIKALFEKVDLMKGKFK